VKPNSSFPPTPQQVVRLAKIFAMLGSSAEGERNAAWAAVTRTLTDIGWDWADVAQRIATPAAPAARPVATEWRTAPLRNHQHIARAVLRQSGAALTSWDRSFLQSLGDLARPLTLRQHAKLSEIVDRASTPYG